MIVHSVKFTRFTGPRPQPCGNAKLILRTTAPAAAAPAPEKASLLTKATRLRRELTKWAAAGLPMAPKDVRRERLAICAACTYFKPTGNWGLGECTAPGCGCTKIKAALATTRCPLGKWPH